MNWFWILFGLSEWILSRLRGKLLKKRYLQFREVIMEPIAFCSLNPVAQQYIDRFEKRIADLNFRRIDNYLYKPAPFLIETRIYLSADCQSIMSIGHCDGNAFYSFESFLNNGIFVETSVCSAAMDVKPFNSVGKCYLQAFSPKDGEVLESILARHEALVQQARRDTCQEPIQIPAEYVTDAIRYVNRKFFEIKYDLEELDERPPLAVWPLTASANAV